MKKIIIILLLFLTITVIPYNSKAFEQGTGLEVESPKLFVYIYDLSKDTKEFGLNKKLIRSKIELALRQNDIEVLNKFDLSPYSLDIKIDFVGDKYSGSFGVDLHFKRIVTYSSGDTTHRKYTPTYVQDVTGTAISKDFIINTLQDEIDIFINEFHKSNDF